jgi:hypothetical protein
MTRPTPTEVADALDVIRRAAGSAKPATVAEALAMSDDEMRAAGVTTDDLFALANVTAPPEAK